MIGYVINLDKDSDRLANIRTELSKLQITFKRIPAVYGRTLTSAEKKGMTTGFCHNFCTPAMIGCAASHLKSWETFLESDEDSALICEDDVTFTENCQSRLQSAIKQLPRDFDLLFAGCMQCTPHKSKTSLVSKFLQLMTPNLGNTEIRWIGSNVYVPHVALGLHCYLISRAGARKLVSLLKNRINYHVDFQINQSFGRMNVYAMHPPIAYQPLASDVSHTVDAYPIIPNRLVRDMDQGGHSGSYVMSVPMLQVAGMQVNMWLVTFSILALSMSLIKDAKRSLTFLAMLVSIITVPDFFKGTIKGHWHFPVSTVIMYVAGKQALT